MGAKKDYEVFGRSTEFPSMSSLSDLAYGRITRDEYRARGEKDLIKRVHVTVRDNNGLQLLDSSAVAPDADDRCSDSTADDR